MNKVLQIHGGYGHLKDFAIPQYLEENQVHEILDGTNQGIQVVIPRDILKTWLCRR